MKNALKISTIGLILAVLSGCTGSVYNKQKSCTYDYLLVPALSVSGLIGSCGPVDK